MAKETGLGWTTLSIDDAGGTQRDVRNPITNFQFATPRGIQDTTGVDKLAMERLSLLVDFSITMNGVFDDGANLAHAVFSSIPSTSVPREFTLVVSNQQLGVTPLCLILLTDYNLTRAQTGEFTFSVPGVLSNGAVPTWATV